MKKLIYTVILILIVGKVYSTTIFVFPTNHIEKKGETIGIVIKEKSLEKVLEISIENQILYPIYRIESNIVFTLVGLPHTILTNFNLTILLSNEITTETSNIIIPFYVNIDPISYAKRKPATVGEIEVKNNFNIKTNRFKIPKEIINNLSAFVIPIEGEIKDGYGVNRSRGGIIEGRIHLGIDILRERGAKVYSTSKGIVITTSKDKKAGNYVVIYHGYNVCSVYMHLSQILVKPGQIVDTNTVIGLVGSTGLSTGPHLHFGISINNIYVDPITFLQRDFSVETITNSGMKIEILPQQEYHPQTNKMIEL